MLSLFLKGVRLVGSEWISMTMVIELDLQQATALFPAEAEFVAPLIHPLPYRVPATHADFQKRHAE